MSCMADAISKQAATKLAEECSGPRGITYPVWLVFDPSVKFDETDPVYSDSHVCALVWRKVWRAIKEHFKAARDEYAHSLYNNHEGLH